MILSFKRDMAHNYMVTESEEILSGSDYQIHMLTENQIEGLLTCSIKRVNGKGRYFYDITSRQSMENIFEKEHIHAEDIRTILRGLYTALTEAKKYLLDINKVVLEPQMIYMDIETKEPLFCYLPVYEGDILSSFGKLTEYIMRRLDQGDSSAVLLGYEIYRKSMEENYSLEKLLKRTAFELPYVKQRKKENDYEELQMKVSLKTVSEDKTDSDKKRDDTRRENIEQRNKEQKNIEKRNIERKNVEKRNIERENAGDESAKQKKQRRQGKTSGKKTAIVKGVWTVLIVAAAAGVIGAAAWFWELDTTQLGGIAFLLAGLLGYGFSEEFKRKKKTEEKLQRKEEKADKKSVRRMRETERNAANSEMAKNKETYIEEKQPQDIDHACVPDRAVRVRQKETSVSQMIGATVLLDEGVEEYEPHLSLISMNPRERNSIVLLNDSYTIGKLKNKSDVCIDHPSISRVHAKIQREGKGYYLCDLNSTNGTFVNGRRLAVNERVPIQMSDEIRFADLGYYVGRC